jgi:hypothetical protein
MTKIKGEEDMPPWDILSCFGKAQNGYSEGVLDQYNMMKMAGFRPDKITL